MCEHCHESCCENSNLQEENNTKIRVARILIAICIFVTINVFNLTGIEKLLFYLGSYFVAGGDVLYKALKNIIKGRVFDENFLMGIATLGAFAIKEYPEAVMVMILYQMGEFLQDKAIEKSRKSIADLMDIRPDYANIEVNNQVIKKSPYEINIGDVIIVKTGEKIPLDGDVIEGKAAVDTSALTGESVLRELKTGDTAISGCININGLLKIKVTKKFEESTVSKILELVEHAATKKAKTENFITKFARYYTPVVVLGAIFLALVPPILLNETFSIWISRALTFLVISCPCALVISVPLSFFAGIGGASKKGILIKGSNYLELLSKPSSVVFDKTGTLTKGVFKVTQIVPFNGFSKEELLSSAAKAEKYSNHPIAVSLKEAYGESIDSNNINDVEEITGCGVKASICGALILVGNEKLMKNFNIDYTSVLESGTIVYVAKNNLFVGYIVISDEIKEDSWLSIKLLKATGTDVVMLTGDTKAVAKSVANKLDIAKVYSQLLPKDKVERLEELLCSNKKGKSIVFVGDGINDAPVLMRADVGIAMGAIGSDAAIEAADVVIMDDKPSKIAYAINIARKTMTIVKQNIVFAIGVKVLFLLLGALGFVTMWGAVFADVGVALIAILNALRALRV